MHGAVLDSLELGLDSIMDLAGYLVGLAQHLRSVVADVDIHIYQIAKEARLQVVNTDHRVLGHDDLLHLGLGFCVSRLVGHLADRVAKDVD